MNIRDRRGILYIVNNLYPFFDLLELNNANGKARKQEKGVLFVHE